MSNREMINYLRDEINDRRYVILYLSSLKSKMECSQDSLVIQREIDNLTDQLEDIKRDYYFYLGEEIKNEDSI